MVNESFNVNGIPVYLEHIMGAASSESGFTQFYTIDNNSTLFACFHTWLLEIHAYVD